MRNFSYIIFLILLLSIKQNNAYGQSSFGVKVGVVVGDNGNIIDDKIKSFRNGYQFGAFGNFGTYSFFISPGIYFKDITIDNHYSEIKPFEKVPRIKIAKAKVIMGYQTNLIKRKIKLKFGGGMHGNYVIHISENDQKVNFETIRDTYLGYSIDLGLDISSLTFGVSYEKSIKEVLKIDDVGSNFDFIVLSAGIIF